MKTKDDYIKMQKGFYNSFNDEDSFKHKVVGTFDFQQSYPYEKWLLNVEGNEGGKLFENTKDLVSLDFGCGMGRMVERMGKLFKRVDGVDIGDNLINYCKNKYPNSNFWITDGNSCGDAFTEHYDFIFSTICMQHICSYDIRMDIWRSIERCLKPNGKFCFQMSCFDNEVELENYRKFHTSHYGVEPKYARWKENHYDANSTNSSHDVYIVVDDIPMIIEDSNSIFKNTKIYRDKFTNNYSKLYITGEKI